MKHEREGNTGHRHQRLEGSILEELRAIVRDDVADATLFGVRITAVALSPDYRNARVHFVVPKGHVRAEVERALERATPFLRGRLAEAIELKRTPDLRFVFEAEIALGLDDESEPPDSTAQTAPASSSAESRTR